tara:strand:- start:263 stop:796 length:534 start_codon:yes stop_codon:yes gene_type:complete
MAIYYGDGTTSNGSSTGGRIVQCITSNKAGHTSHTGQSWSSNVGGLTSSITMKDSNNKILIMYNVSVSAAPNVYSAQIRLMRDSTHINAGILNETNHVPANNHYFTSYDSYSHYTFSNMSNGAIDSPGDTNSHTYSIQLRSGYANYTVYINRPYVSSNYNNLGSASSFLTLFEIAHD